MGVDIGRSIGTYEEDGLTYHEKNGTDDVHFSYIGFNRFREDIADTIGIRLGDMQGFGGSRPWDEVDSGLVPLLNHSDCDGDLTPDECARVWPALDVAVAEAYEQDDEIHRPRGDAFVTLLRAAAENDQTVVFT